MKTLIITILSAFILTTNVQALVPTNPNSTEVLYVEAQTLELDEACGNVKVTIIADGEIVDQFVTKKKGKFHYYFDANTYYDVLFEKQGYITKNVQVNTYTRKLNNDFQVFDFNVAMVKGTSTSSEDIAKIFVPKQGDKFTYAVL